MPKEELKKETEEKLKQEVLDWVDNEFRNKLSKLLNNYGWDNTCETPDHILADYIVSCLENYCATTAKNIAWHSVWKKNVLQSKRTRISKEEQRKNNGLEEQLTKAKELLTTYKDFLEYDGLTTRLGNLYDRTVQFLRRVNK